MKSFLVRAVVAIIAMLPRVASADLIVTMDTGFNYSLESVDAGLTIGLNGFDESYLNGANGAWSFSGADEALWSVGDVFSHSGSATNGINPNAAVELRVELVNSTANPLSATFELEGTRLFAVDIDSPRELQGIAQFFLFDENGSLEAFDTYNQMINTDTFFDGNSFPPAYLQEVTIAPNSSAIIQLFYGSLINGDATTAIPEPNSIVLIGGLSIVGLFVGRRLRRNVFN